MHRFASIGASLHQHEAADDGRDGDDAISERDFGGWNETGGSEEDGCGRTGNAEERRSAAFQGCATFTGTAYDGS